MQNLEDGLVKKISHFWCFLKMHRVWRSSVRQSRAGSAFVMDRDAAHMESAVTVMHY